MHGGPFYVFTESSLFRVADMKRLLVLILLFVTFKEIAVGQTNWSLQFSGHSEKMIGIAFGDNKFAVATQHSQSEPNRIYSSFDGSTWVYERDLSLTSRQPIRHNGSSFFGATYRTSGAFYVGDNLADLRLTQIPNTLTTFRNLAEGNGIRVAVGGGSIIRTSTNGGPWVAAPSPVVDSFTDVLFDGNSFVALTYNSLVLQSFDGLRWRIKQGQRRPSSGYIDLEYGDGSYVAVSDMGPALFSNDLVTWNESEDAAITEAVEYANGKFVAVKSQDWPRAILVSSDGGASWEPADTGIQVGMRGIAYGNGYWAAVGGNGIILRARDDDIPLPVNRTIQASTITGNGSVQGAGVFPDGSNVTLEDARKAIEAAKTVLNLS